MSDIMLISKTHAYKSFEYEIKYCGWGAMEDYEAAFKVHFIALRYLGKELDDAKYKQWRKSYQGLPGWLRANSSK